MNKEIRKLQRSKTLKIEIIKTEILANILKDGSNYLLGANGKLIETNDFFNVNDFLALNRYKLLKKLSKHDYLYKLYDD